MGRLISPIEEEIPNLKTRPTAGELCVLQFFRSNLNDNWEIYFQPHLNGCRPDFVLLNPNVGIGVFEVKDWDLKAQNLSYTDGKHGPRTLTGEASGVISKRIVSAPHAVKNLRQSEFKAEIVSVAVPLGTK